MEKKCKECGCAMSECTCAKGMCPECKCPAGHCCCKKKKCCVRTLVLGLLIMAGPALAGYFIAESLKSPATNDRFINVNVAVEKEEKADYAIWNLSFQNTGNDIKILQEKYVKDRDAIVAFLKQRGFKDDEIQVKGPQITDQFAREWGHADVQKLPENSRYILKSTIKVSTPNVDGVIAAVQEQDNLIKEGIILSHTDRWSEGEGPLYYLKNQLKVEQDLFGEALKKANVLAKQLAEGMNVKIKDLRSTEQKEPVSIISQDQSGGEGSRWGMERLKGLKPLL